MKPEATFHGIPVYSTPLVQPNTVYFIDGSKFEIKYPKRKDGGLDMRYRINKLKTLLKI